MLIGRKAEISIIEKCLQDDKSHFIAIYGRCRVGKTFMIKEYFKHKFEFYVTGIAYADMKSQLLNFDLALDTSATSLLSIEAFNSLLSKLERSKSKKRVVFIDELPWMDTLRSGYMLGLAYFWNSWASGQKNVVLLVCGSAASWMINKLINVNSNTELGF